MIDVQRVVSWISVLVVLCAGLFLIAFIPLPDSNLRWIIGIVVVLYVGIRAILLFSARGGGGKKA